MPRIEGTERTRALIGNIVKDLHSKRPQENHVDYIISTGVLSELRTSEQGDKFRNVSIIDLGRIHAVIGNKTGNILMSKPLLMTKNGAVKRICIFLEAIQPERLDSAKITHVETDSFRGKDGPAYDRSSVSHTFQIGWEKIKRTIAACNNMWSGECCDAYKTL